MSTPAAPLVRKTIVFSMLLLAAWSAAGCATVSTSAQQPGPRLERAELGDTPNVHRHGDILLSGQPGQADLRKAAEAGVGTVVDLRPPSESRGFDERAAAAELGLEYVNPGFREPESLTHEVFDRVRASLRDAQGRGVLLHCSSANRVGAVWLAYRVLDDGVDYQHALEEARRIGLRTPAYTERARGYIRARGGSAEMREEEPRPRG